MTNLASRLTSLVNQLKEKLNIDSIGSRDSNKKKITDEDSQAISFLMQVLEAMHCSNSSPEIVYPLLIANTDKLDQIFARNLRYWMTNFLKQAEANIAKSGAEIIGNFGTLIAQFPSGNKANNIEIAIACYETSMQVFTREHYPEDWAKTQLNLGNIYIERVKEDKADNIEGAISYCQAALQVLTRQAFPQPWAIAQMTLGTAYINRIKEDKAENIENAISCCNAALEVFKREVFPQYWAQTQFNLGLVYINRIEGNTTDNIENAIEAFQLALEVFKREAFPQYWAQTQFNLGMAYTDRINENKTDSIEKAISYYNASFQVFTYQDFPQQWAWARNNLGNAYINRIKGDKAENIEKAIEALQSALQVRTREAFPKDWANTQNSLGFAYINRIKGDKAENIEKAIEALQSALQVITCNAFPQDWAGTQLNLGIAYWDRIKGDKAENIENSISFYQAALEVLTCQTYPQNWAKAQNNLGTAYISRIKGDKAENIENAIKTFCAVLEVSNREVLSQDWITTQHNLGAAYWERIKGDKAENIENAIKAYYAALEISTYESSPQQWAMTQNNLGLAYIDRIKGNKASNLENAIEAFHAALRVYTLEADPQKWAMTQHNLGNAYINISKIKPDEIDKIENAINAYRDALQVRTRQAFPEYWAMTQLSLGNAYWFKGIKGDLSENVENAINAFHAALEVYTRQAFPQQWSMAQSNLGLAYKSRAQGNQGENIKNAIEALEAALKVRTREAFPHNHAETLFNLGTTYQYAGMLDSAYATYKSAIATVDLLRGNIISGEESKRKQAEQFNEVYIRMVEVCLELGGLVNSPFVQWSSLPLDIMAEAIEYVERSKTRNLVELILDRDLKTTFPPEVATQLEQLQDEIAVVQDQIQNGIDETLTPLAQHLENLWQQRQELQDKYLPVGSGFKFDLFQSGLDEETAIIEWYITFSGLETFVITRNSLQRLSVSQPNEKLDALIDWNNEYLRAYENKKTNEWKDHLTSRLIRLAEILHIEDVVQLIPKTCTRIILIPHRYLHLFPLHLLSLANGQLLCERYPKGVSYAPSCQLWQQIQKRERPDCTSIFAIQNPTKDLNFADLEVETIVNLFSSHQRLFYEQATKNTLLQQLSQLRAADSLHFSCHGSFNSDSPQKSCLKLAESVDNNDELDLNKCLTLSNLFERDFQLDNCRLVVLSACETGLIDFKNTSDEYIGLPSGFLYAGSVSVVSSLWTVNDLSTAFLMIKFYQNLQAVHSVAVALNQAQLWLRCVTKAELRAWITANSLPLNPTMRQNLNKRLHKLQDDDQPFQSPYHWAAFCAIGQ